MELRERRLGAEAETGAEIGGVAGGGDWERRLVRRLVVLPVATTLLHLKLRGQGHLMTTT